MKTKKKLIKVVPYEEIVGTSWNLHAVVYCSLNTLLKKLNIPYSKVDVSRLTDKTRYSLYLKADGLPAFTIYDRCSFPYGRKYDDEKSVIIHWHIGTFDEELCVRTCEFLNSKGLKVTYTDTEFNCHCSLNGDIVVTDLPF